MNYHEQADCQNNTFKKKHILKLILKLISSKESLEYICHSFGDLLRSTQLVKNMDSKDNVPWLKQVFYAFESQKGPECCSAWSRRVRHGRETEQKRVPGSHEKARVGCPERIALKHVYY